jgi:YidC/Oxa1 family membrane protein insertase
MFSTIWHTFFFDPVYNGLVFFIDVVPGGDIGLAIIFTTIVVKFILLPLSIKAAKTQKIIREIDPQIKEIKESIKDDPQKQAQAIMDLYKASGINPFASILLMFIQIPIIIALYFSVYSGGGVPLPDINVDLLYSFVPAPETVSMLFLGMLDIAQKSLPLAIIAGIAQFVHGRLAFPTLPPRDPNKAPSMKDDFQRNLQLQMKYGMPILIVIFAYTISAAIALYFIVSSLTAIAQELVIKKHK